MVNIRYLMILLITLSACANHIELKGNYEEIDENIKFQLEQEVLALIENRTRIVDLERDASSDPNVIDFRDTPKKFINYFAEFAKKQMAKDGLVREPLESATIEIVSPEMVQKRCGETALACNIEGHILMPNALNFVKFMVVFNHEFGHQMYLGNAEYPALANELYASLQTYKFSKRIGSLFLNFLFKVRSVESPDEASSFNGMYEKAGLYALLNLNNYGANTEKALDYITHVPQLSIDAQLDKFVKEYPGKDAFELHSILWDSIIYNISIDVPRDKNVLLSLCLSLLHFNYCKLFGHTSVVDKERVITLLSETWTENEYFTSKAVKSRSYDLLQKIRSLISETDETTDIPYNEIYGLARKMVEINSPYPCFEKDAYSCPNTYRGFQTVQMLGYDIAAYVARNSPAFELPFVNIAMDFIYKFKFDNYISQRPLEARKANNQLVFVASLVGDILNKHALNIVEVCRAQKYYLLADSIECNTKSVMYSKIACEKRKLEFQEKVKNISICGDPYEISTIDIFGMAN